MAIYARLNFGTIELAIDQKAINLQNTVKKLRIGSIFQIFDVRQSKEEIDELKRTH